MAFNIVKLLDPIQLVNIPGGLVPRGAYNNGTDYTVGDSVSYQGSSYVMYSDAGAGTVPTNTTYWQVLANKGDTTSLTSGNGITITGLSVAIDTSVTVDETTAQTLTNKRLTRRVLSLSAGSATPAINTDSYDVVHITAQSAAITSFTTNLTGTPVDGDQFRISITDDGTARALTWGAKFESSQAILPTTTEISTRLDVGFFWNTETNRWRCVSLA